MDFILSNNKRQYIVGILSILIVSFACFVLRAHLNYRIVALILLLTVSIIAMVYDILPVLISAILSAFIWNYCFIPPIFTLDISNAEDLLMFLSYFFVALLNAVLNFKIRQIEKKARDKEEREKTIKLYSTLFNSLSHELKTPIATIIGTVDTLKAFNNSLNKEQQFDLLNDIDLASIRLNKQVENILNMSRLESGILCPKLDWCDLDELAYMIIQKMDTSHRHQIVYNSSDQLPLFKIDVGFMEQILFNILYNAIQYTPNETRINLNIEHHSNCCWIVISDNGPGIPEDELRFIFDKFYRISNSKSGGSGLGLSIVKGFTEALNGSIIAENNVEGGLKFTIKIPAETSYINKLKNE
ncbi:ATP-binding protein [Flavobacterium sp. I3-2]|uniref:sensor histidine kinase n=1 Tax=Flavobacterium sp. I3-2 TaxID=2748319 RepID=UPI0015B130CC|nr:ATP-binding protein [Flavobacterium sp. I3-2]